MNEYKKLEKDSPHLSSVVSFEASLTKCYLGRSRKDARSDNIYKVHIGGFPDNINKGILRRNGEKLAQYICQVTVQFSNLELTVGTRIECRREGRETWDILYLNYSTSTFNKAIKFLFSKFIPFATVAVSSVLYVGLIHGPSQVLQHPSVNLFLTCI